METRFKIDDKIAYMKDNKVCMNKIKGISTYKGKIHELHKQCEIKEGECEVVYHCDSYNEVKDNDAFASIEELKKALFSHIEK